MLKTNFIKVIAITIVIAISAVAIAEARSLQQEVKQSETVKQESSSVTEAKPKHEQPDKPPKKATKKQVKKLTVKQKIAKNHYKCDLKTQYVRKDNAQCLDKPKKTQTPPKTQNTPRQAQNGSGSCALAYNYNWPQGIAYQICMKESGGNPNASNWSDNHMSWAGCMGSFGLMQVNCSHGRLYNGAENMRVAYSIYKSWGNSFAAWTTCKYVSGCR